MMMQSRIAAVSYLNTIPFIYGIEHSGVDLSAELLLSPPRKCATAVEEGRADIALIPVAAIPSIQNINLITSFCIGASADVRTVILASNSNLCDIQTIYLDSHSLTSVRLARILAAEHWNITPEWRELDDYSLLDNQPANSGFIIIGDKVFDAEYKFKYKFDLALEWCALTGLPFVFAAWIAKKGVDSKIVDSLESALDYGVHHIDEAIACYGYSSKSYAHQYLTHNIDFVFDVEKRRAMELFWEKGMRISPLINPG